MSSRTETAQIPDHTLLRVIGRGSYGEVWLARNVMGTHRAVKIVRRSAFDSDRPYLREFEGIRRCEPVSRAHDGLIDILHMGRNDEEGWFYYVMELADGALTETSGTPGADGFQTYRPATLGERLTGGSLEALECLRVAESLTGALAFLHEQGLIHRDVKPSNIMYAGGVPKLGDIGLVAEAGSSRSFVGTEGFVPQEGPGTERADIFALGKVLYEALTGLDRSKFPQLPEDWGQSYDFEQRVELNEIVLRACEGHAERRYLSAREMQADIALVASGRSVRKMRGMEHRLKLLRWLGLGAAAVAVLAIGTSWLVQKQADRERILRVRAEDAEQSMRKARLLLLYDQVHSARRDPGAGAVTRALQLAKEAAALSPTPQLRDDAIFLLGRPDFVVREDLKPKWSTPQVFPAMDADSGLCAETPITVKPETPGPATVTLHVNGAEENRRSFVVEKPPPWLSALELSRGGARLLMAGWYGGGTVLDTATGAVIASWPPESDFTSPLTFCGDKGDAVIRRSGEGGLTIMQLPSGEPRTTAKLENWPQRDQKKSNIHARLWPSPDGKSVLLIDDELRYPPPADTVLSRLLPAPSSRPQAGAACLVDTATGRQLWIRGTTTEAVAAWSPDGTRLALRRGPTIQAVDAVSGNTVFTLPATLYSPGTELFFMHDRDHLAFHTWGDYGFFQLASGERLCQPPVQGLDRFSKERSLLTTTNGSAEWRPSKVRRTFIQRTLEEGVPRFFTFSPDDSCIIAGDRERFNIWPLDRDECVPIADYPAHGATGVLFSNKGKTAEFLTSSGISTIPWTNPPAPALPDPLPTGLPPGTQSDYYSVSADGKVKALGGRRFAAVLKEGEPPRMFSIKNSSSNTVALSPDARWLAVGATFSQSVFIWDLHRQDDTPVHTVECGGPCLPLFSPLGKWLAISGGVDNRILETGTWKPVISFPRISTSVLGELSFTADEKLMSVKHQPRGCTIIETGSWRTRYEITSPLDEPFSRCGLSPGGRYFAAVGTRREIHVWDLLALNTELEKLGLGVDGPPEKKVPPVQ